MDKEKTTEVKMRCQKRKDILWLKEMVAQNPYAISPPLSREGISSSWEHDHQQNTSYVQEGDRPAINCWS